MKNRGKSFFMALLLVVQVLMSPIGLVSADTTADSSALGGGVELYSVNKGAETPTEKLSVSSYSGDYKIAAKLNNQTQESFDGGKIRIRLNRRDFAQPTAEGLAKPADNEFADKLEGGKVITTDDKDWIIEYDLKQVSPGENLEIPSVVTPIHLNIDQTRGNITEEILDQHDQVVTTADKGYYIDTAPMLDKGIYMSQQTDANSTNLYYYYNYQDKKDQLKPNGDGSYTTLTDQTTNMYVYYLYKDSADSRNIVVTIDLSKLDVLQFNTNAPNGWSYDAATKKATRTFTRDEFFGERQPQYLPLKVPAGSKLTFEANKEYQEVVSYEVRYEGSANPVSSNRIWRATLELKTGQNWDPLPAGNGVQDATNSTKAYLADVNSQTKLRYSVEAADQIAGGGFQHIPAGVELPVKTLKAMLPTDFYQDNQLKAFALKTAKTPNLPGMTNNHLYGINADGSLDLLTDNLGTTDWDASQLKKKYQGFQLDFDQPIMVTNPDASFGFNIITTMSEQSLQDFRNDSTKYYRYYGLGNLYAKYPGYYQDEFKDDRSYGNFYLYKYKNDGTQPAEIDTQDNNDSVSVVNGHDFTLKRRVTLQSNYANTKFANGKVYFLVPENTRLSADQSGLKGLEHPQVIANFHNSGRTAIVADIVPVASAENGFTAYDFSLTLDAAQLRQGDNYQIEAYLVYNNNDGSYDLNNPAGANSIVTPELKSGDPYQLYTDTKDPTKGLKLATTKLVYMPIAGLKVANLVAKGTGGYSSDLGAYGYAGDVIKYRTNLYNGYSEAAKNIGLVNYLPVAGVNGSTFNVTLAGPVSITNKTTTTASPIDYQAAFKVYYATAKPNYDASDYGNTVVWRTASQLAPTDYPKVTMMKMALDPAIPFDPKADVDFDYPAQMTKADTPENSQAINQVQLINSSGTYYNVNQAKVTMNYPVNAVQVTKTDANTKAPLYGAQFRLLNGQGESLGTQLYETNADGKVQISNLKAGQYYLEEAAAPSGYVLPTGDAAKTAFTISKTADTPTSVGITNVSKATPQGNVLITNQDTDTGKALNGAHFSLNRVTAIGETPVAADLVIKTNGQLNYTGLLPGQYRLRQSTAPSGYLINSQVFDVTINVGETSAVVVKNAVIPAPVKGQLTVINHEKDQPNKLIAGSEFKLIDQASGETVADKLVTDKNGQIVQKDLPAGTYDLKQVSVPDGYLLNTTTQTVEISKDQPTVTTKFANETKPVTPEPVKGQVTIINHEKDQPSKLIAGSEFKLIDQASGKTVADKLVTDNNGQIIQKDLPAGTYDLKQVAVPDGYLLNPKSQVVEISKDTPMVTAEFVNEAKPETPEPVKGQVTIINHEKDQPSRLIAGSEFKLIDQKTGKTVADKLVTDKNGQIIQKDLPAGTYDLKQVAVPDGYLLNTTTQTVEISKDTPKVTTKFANEVKPVTPQPVNGQVTIINHEKDQPNKLIAGSEFELIDQKTGRTVTDKLVTDKNGQVIQKDLLAGTYSLKQVSVPDGYVLNTATQPVEITKDATNVIVKFVNAAKAVTPEPEPQPVKGQVTVINQVKDQPSKLIAGSEFKLIDQKSGKTVADKLVTDKNGQIIQKDLPAGTYDLKQVTVPDGYVLSAATQSVEITKDATNVTVKFVNAAKAVTPEPEPQPDPEPEPQPVKGQVTIINHENNQPNKPIVGSEFKLIDQKSGKTVAEKLVTDRNGQIVQNGLPVSDYVLKQVTVPAEYLLNTQSQSVKILKANAAVTVKVVNDVKPVTPVVPEPVKGQLTIINHAKNQPSKLLVGSVFALIDQSTGKAVASQLVTDKNGQIVQTGLPVGNYQLKQVSVPTGYQLNTGTQSVQITKAAPSVTVQFANELKTPISKPVGEKPVQPVVKPTTKPQPSVTVPAKNASQSTKTPVKGKVATEVKTTAKDKVTPKVKTRAKAKKTTKAVAATRHSKNKHLPQSNEQWSVGLLVLGILLLGLVLAYAWKKSNRSAH